MKLTFKTEDHSKEIEDVSKDIILTVLEQLDPERCPYLILEGIHGDYIQCFCGDRGYVVEARFSFTWPGVQVFCVE